MFDHQITIKRLHQIDEIVNKNLDLLASNVPLAREDAGGDDATSIQKKVEHDQDQNRVLQIGIIGRVKAGKSSLLNALFFNGENILPQAATPMTAALTTLSYGDHPTMKVEFFTEDDLQTFKRLSEEHERVIEDALQVMLSMRQKRMDSSNSMPARPAALSLNDSSIDNMRELVKKDIASKNPTGASASDIWQSVVNAGGVKFAPKNDDIKLKSIGELQGQLEKYVGAKGKFTPFTKCLHLELPFEGLRDLRIVDTPGLNDPIVSREDRTQKMLSQCDVAFVVSPAGQFLSAQDLELLERLNDKKGITEVYVIASQFDNQLFGQELRACNGSLPDLISMQRVSLARQAKNVFSKLVEHRQEFRKLIDDSERRVLTTSSVAYALTHQKPAQWSDSAKHIHGRLLKIFPDYFSSAESTQQWLGNLSGLPTVLQAVSDVRSKKDETLAERLGNYLKSQEIASRKYASCLLKSVQDQKNKIETTDIADTNNQFKDIEKVSRLGANKVNDLFDEGIEIITTEVAKELKRIIKNNFEEATQATDSAQSSDSVRVEKDGALGWIARKFGTGGYEERNVHAIEASVVRRSIDTFRDTLGDELTAKVMEISRGWRKELKKDILAALRVSIGDANVDVDILDQGIRKALLLIRDLPEPELPPMPEELSANGRLKGWSANNFQTAAYEYIKELKEFGNVFVKEVKKTLNEMNQIRLGDEVFGELLSETQKLKEQLNNKHATVERLSRLIDDLKKVA